MKCIAAPAPLLFFRSLLQDPKGIGAVVPSSPRLSQLMASCVDPSETPVLEIGAGTGAITRALLDRGLEPEKLFVIERDPQLAAFLRREFRGVRVGCGEAIDSRRILREHDVPPVKSVVSSLPLRNFSPLDKVRNVRAMMNSLARDGQLLQYTYVAGCPIPSRRLGLHAECIGRVWRNLPPAAVWRFRVREAGSLTA